MSEFAFIETSPGRFLFGAGPFTSSAAPDPSRPAFYVNDFFLEDPEPWKHPATAQELNAAGLRSQFPPGETPAIAWDPLPSASFESLFRSAHSGIMSGAFRKIVPVLFESGRLQTSAEGLVSHIVHHLPSLPPTIHAYGCRLENRQVLGATPEILFQTDGRTYETMALAGTRPVESADSLLTDPKEREEHRIVVEDISSRLTPRGTVTTGETAVVRYPTLAHLHTRILFVPRDPAGFAFEDMVTLLHPTAALGSSPRSEGSARWLRQADRGVGRGAFGAPFGFRHPDGSAVCLVAIRNLTWSETMVRLGSGVGVVRESTFAREFEELRRKREQVKSLLGLNGG